MCRDPVGGQLHRILVTMEKRAGSSEALALQAGGAGGFDGSGSDGERRGTTAAPQPSGEKRRWHWEVGR